MQLHSAYDHYTWHYKYIQYQLTTWVQPPFWIFFFFWGGGKENILKKKTFIHFVILFLAA